MGVWKVWGLLRHSLDFFQQIKMQVLVFVPTESCADALSHGPVAFVQHCWRQQTRHLQSRMPSCGSLDVGLDVHAWEQRSPVEDSFPPHPVWRPIFVLMMLCLASQMMAVDFVTCCSWSTKLSGHQMPALAFLLSFSFGPGVLTSEVCLMLRLVAMGC